MKGKIHFKKQTFNDSKSFLGYFNKLLDEYNNTYHHSIGKKPIDADYSTLTEKIEMNPEVPKIKVGDRARITKYNNIFSKGYTENWSRKIFVFKTNPWTNQRFKRRNNNTELSWKRIVAEQIINESLSRTR